MSVLKFTARNLPNLIESLRFNLSKPMVHTRGLSDERRPIEKGLNQVMLMGRCGTDAQLKGTQGNPVVLFPLATHINYKANDSDQYLQKTDWHRIAVFRTRLQQKTLEFAKKGVRVYVQGRLSYGEVTDSSGSSHQTTSIIADDIIFLSGAKSHESIDEESSSTEAAGLR